MKHLKSINWSKVAFPLILGAAAFVNELVNTRREEKMDKLMGQTEAFYNSLTELCEKNETEQEEA